MTWTASERDVADTQASIIVGSYSVSWRISGDAPSLGEHAEQLGRFLAQGVRMREPLHIHLVPVEDAMVDVAHTDLLVRVVALGGRVVVHDLALGGATTHAVVLDLPLEEAQTRIARLLRTYLVEGCGRDTFSSWVRALPASALRARLGVTESQTTNDVARSVASFA
jgi:hypothetical protein